MKYFEWNDKYNIGVEIIDGQHKRLMQILDNFHNSILVENGTKVLAFILDDLLEYSYYHFETEEPMLEKKAGYDFLSHKTYHDELINELILMKEDLVKGKFIPTIESAKQLRSWWINHILEEDKKAFQ